MPLITLRNSNSNSSFAIHSDDIRRLERVPHAWPAYTALRDPSGRVIEVCETPDEVRALIAKASEPQAPVTPPAATTDRILGWFRRAVPQPSKTNRSVQIGCHFEEVAEMAEALGLAILAEQLHVRANQFKAGSNLGFNRKDELLDALCDQIVTAIGVGHMFGFDMAGALAEVDRSNWSKFDADGNPLFNEQGKIKKGSNYTPPDLSPYLGSEL